MLKLLFLTHRYLGITLCLVMLLWCVSGFIMMYKPYPELNYQEQLQTLVPLELENCCSTLPENEFAGEQFEAMQVLMLQNEAVVHLYSSFGSLTTLRLKDSKVFDRVNEDDAMQVADLYQARYNYPEAELLDTVHNDQWTVYGAYNPHRPLYHFAANDVAGTEWYISSRTGEIIQHTTRDQRIWGYLGAVIHWLYPTILREKVQLWSQVVIWLTVLGIFLTVTGLYFGIRQYKTRRNGRHSPYRGLALWHHYTGIIFGVLTLSWVVSGLFSMQPLGLMEGSGAGQEARRLSGGSISVDEINSALLSLNNLRLSPETVLVEGRKLGGEFFLYSVDSNENTLRYQPHDLHPAPLTEAELVSLAQEMLPDSEITSTALLYEEDDYYFSHHDPVRLPVFKIETGGDDKTIYYMNPDNAQLLGKYDTASRWYRWLHYGLHRLDFTPLMRSRPIWDILMWTLMGGVTVGVFSGFFLGIRRIYRSI